MPKPYPVAFRRKALAMLDDGCTVRDVAASLGIAELCLHRWRRQQCIELGLASGVSDADQSELAAAKQRIRDLEEEVKIFRKAAVAAQEVVPPKAVSAWSRNWQLKGCGSVGRAKRPVSRHRVL